MARLLHDVGTALFSGAVLSLVFTAVTAEVDADRADREAARQEHFQRAILFATADDLSGFQLVDEFLFKQYMAGINFTEADFSQAEILFSNLRGANLTRADLSGAYIYATDLRNVILSDADLSFSTLDDVDLRGANLSGTNLDSVSFGRYGRKSLCYDTTTIWPSGYKVPDEVNVTCPINAWPARSETTARS